MSTRDYLREHRALVAVIVAWAISVVLFMATGELETLVPAVGCVLLLFGMLIVGLFR